MFIEKYVNEYYYELILDSYREEYLKSLDEQEFIKNYQILKAYGFYFIEDIILKYLEIFSMDTSILIEKLNLLKEKLGKDFVFKIGNHIQYLNEILD